MSPAESRVVGRSITAVGLNPRATALTTYNVAVKLHFEDRTTKEVVVSIDLASLRDGTLTSCPARIPGPSVLETRRVEISETNE